MSLSLMNPVVNMKNAPFRERLFLALDELYTKEIKYTKNYTYNAVDFEKCTDKSRIPITGIFARIAISHPTTAQTTRNITS